jgi:hypothetical protein
LCCGAVVMCCARDVDEGRQIRGMFPEVHSEDKSVGIKMEMRFVFFGFPFFAHYIVCLSKSLFPPNTYHTG